MPFSEEEERIIDGIWGDAEKMSQYFRGLPKRTTNHFMLNQFDNTFSVVRFTEKKRGSEKWFFTGVLPSVFTKEEALKLMEIKAKRQAFRTMER